MFSRNTSSKKQTHQQKRLIDLLVLATRLFGSCHENKQTRVPLVPSSNSQVTILQNPFAALSFSQICFKPFCALCLLYFPPFYRWVPWAPGDASRSAVEPGRRTHFRLAGEDKMTDDSSVHLFSLYARPHAF